MDLITLQNGLKKLIKKHGNKNSADLSINFINPSMNLQRFDNLKLRKRIIELNQKEAQEIGITRSTFHYLQKNARKEKSFIVYKNVASKIEKAS